jgi:hypothetical protein
MGEEDENGDSRFGKRMEMLFMGTETQLRTGDCRTVHKVFGRNR